MDSIWQNTVENYNYLFNEISHPLTKDWALIPSASTLFAILVTYNIFCIKLGPTLMQNKQPYKLDKLIKLYNIFQVIISLYLTYEGYVYLFSGKFNFNCQGIGEHEDDKTVIRVAQGIRVYFVTKLIELLDTVFFVLRKSYRQITFLHLYHHTLMPTISWVGLKYFPGGQGVLFGVINSLVHVVMYTYYFISGLGPQYQKFLWWKKYLTVMQIVQFLLVLLHSTNSLFYSCSYLNILKLLTGFFALIFVHMFSKFYYHSYIKKNKTERSRTANKNQIAANCETMNKNGSNKNMVDETKPIANGYFVSEDLKASLSKNGNGNSNGSNYTNGNSNGSNYTNRNSNGSNYTNGNSNGSNYTNGNSNGNNYTNGKQVSNKEKNKDL